MKGYLLTSALVLTHLSTWAEGKIKGQVFDKLQNDVAIGAEVQIKKEGSTTASLFTTTDVDGAFEVSLEDGIYEVNVDYMGYQPQQIKQIVVKNNEIVSVNISLENRSEDTHLEEVIVRGNVKKSSINNLYVQQKTSATVSDGVSADVIAKSADRNTSEVLKRVSGATIQDNKFVVVRGMNDRYNVAMVDGAVLPSTEPNRKAFSFDIIPSTVIDNIVISKSGSPNLPGDFAGGVINIVSKDIPNEAYSNISFSTSLNTLSTFKDFKTGFKSSTDFLGFDDGSRQLPKSLPSFVDMRNPNYFNPNNKEQNQNYLSLLNNDYSVKHRTALPSINLQYARGNGYNLKNGNKLGYNAGVTYSHQENIRPNVLRQYGNFDYLNQVYGYNTTLGALLNIAYNTDKSKISFKNLYNRIFDDKYLERQGTNMGSSKDIQYSAFDLTQKSLLKSTLIGEHSLNNNRNEKLDWLVSYNYVTNNQPDQKKATYSRDMWTSNPFLADISNLGKANNRLFGNMSEHIAQASVNYNIALDKKLQHQLKVGASEQVRLRSFSNRYLGAVMNVSNPNVLDILNSPLDQLYSNKNINNNNFQFIDQTLDADLYDAQTYTSAAYAMMDSRLKDKFRFVYGVRAEHYMINLDSYSKNEVNTDWLHILPSLNFTFEQNAKTNWRASYFKSLVRPELREMANLSYYDYELDATFTGNTTLVPTTIHNVDLRYEYFPQSGEIISASLFYKHFTNTIENNLYGVNSAYDITPKNFSGGYNIGAEFEIRKNLGFINPETIWEQFSLYTNVAYVKSSISLPENYYISGQLQTSRPLTGQSPLVINTSIGYQSKNNKLGMNILYNYLGSNLYMVGHEFLGHVYLNARHVMDFTANYNVTDRWAFKLSIKDLFNSPYTFFMDQDVDGVFKRNNYTKGTAMEVDKDWVWQEYKPGMTIGLSVNYKIK